MTDSHDIGAIESMVAKLESQGPPLLGGTTDGKIPDRVKDAIRKGQYETIRVGGHAEVARQ